MEKKLIIGLVVGFLIGGIFVGVLDAHRPEPLFSSAKMMDNSNTNPNSNTVPNANTVRPGTKSDSSDYSQ
ncbi:MAG TPA: hypothetical protein VHQ41_03060 [Patescibacteria group bacterium]|jgi:hypothetical protein|nr:hypothetical protein [Patescibacteria group bacterium]